MGPAARTSAVDSSANLLKFSWNSWPSLVTSVAKSAVPVQLFFGLRSSAAGEDERVMRLRYRRGGGDEPGTLLQALGTWRLKTSVGVSGRGKGGRGGGGGRTVDFVLGLGELAAVDGIEDGAGVLEGAALAAGGSAGTDPARVEQPGVGLVVGDFVGEHGGVAHGVQGQEGLGEARGEGGLGLGDAVLGAGHLGGVAADEVEHGLGGAELGNGRQHAAGVAGEEDDVGGVVRREAGDLGVINVLDGVGAARVLRQRRVVVVHDAGDGVEDDVFQDGAVFDGVENVGFPLARKADAFGVAAAFDVEDALFAPAVLVVADQRAFRVGR